MLPNGIEGSLKATADADLKAKVFLALLNEGYEIYQETYWSSSPLDQLLAVVIEQELKALMKALPASMRPDLHFCACGKIRKGVTVCDPIDVTK